MQSIYTGPYLFNDEQLFSLRDENTLALINNNKLTIEQFITLNNSQLWSLREEHIVAFINNDILTIEQFIQLDSAQLRDLNRKYIQRLIANRNITIEQFMQLNDEKQNYLRYEDICLLIANNRLTFEQFVQLNDMQLRYLLNPDINALIANQHLTVEQFMQLNEEQIDTIINMDEDTLTRVLDRNLNIEDVIGGNTITINDEQSTHNAAIYKSVSISIMKLKQDYEQFINTKNKLDKAIIYIKHKIFSLPDSLKNNAAKSCINRLTADDYTFIDQTSQTTIKQLLALVFLAILDDEKRAKNNIFISLEEAMEVFIQGLYEIQRGYNLNYNEIDDTTEDRPICAGGTFNKLVEKLVGIYPDCNLCFITHEIAALKFPKVVEKEALLYVAQLANPKTSAEFISFNKLIASIKQNGLKIIYNQIKDSVANIMFKEFGSLYVNEFDHSFTSLISTIEDVELDDTKLDQFQQSIKNSPGYQQYCSHLLYRSTGKLSFLSTQKSDQEPDNKLEVCFNSLSLAKN